MDDSILDQLERALKELQRYALNGIDVVPHHDWKNEPIETLRWRYSVDYVSCITLARKWFFDGDEVNHQRIHRFSDRTSNVVQLRRDDEKISVKVLLEKGRLEFSHAFDYEPA